MGTKAVRVSSGPQELVTPAYKKDHAHPRAPGRSQTYPTQHFRAQNGAKTLPSCPSLKGTELVLPLTLTHTAKAQGTQEAGVSQLTL